MAKDSSYNNLFNVLNWKLSKFLTPALWLLIIIIYYLKSSESAKVEPINQANISLADAYFHKTEGPSSVTEDRLLQLFAVDQSIQKPPNAELNSNLMGYLEQGYYLKFPSGTLWGEPNHMIANTKQGFISINSRGEEVTVQDYEGDNLYIHYISDGKFEVYNLKMIGNILKLSLHTSFENPGVFKIFLDYNFLRAGQTTGIAKIKLLNPTTFEVFELEPYIAKPTNASSREQQFFKPEKSLSLNRKKALNPPMSKVLNKINEASKKLASDQTRTATGKTKLAAFFEFLSDSIVNANKNNNLNGNIAALEKLVKDFNAQFGKITQLKNIPGDISNFKDLIQDRINELKKESKEENETPIKTQQQQVM